jgi:hypothetical protein
MQSACLCSKKERKLVMSFSNVEPQSFGSNFLARHRNHLCRNELQYLTSDYDEKDLSYLGLHLMQTWTATRLGVTTTWLKLKARVWGIQGSW